MQGFGGDDSDFDSPRNNKVVGLEFKPTEDSQPVAESNVLFSEQLDRHKKTSENEIATASELPNNGSQRSMGEILSSMDQGLPHSSSGKDSSAEKSSSKLTSSNLSAKRSAFWGRNNVSVGPHDIFVTKSLYIIFMLQKMWLQFSSFFLSSLLLIFYGS